ncbi:hypothetical protein ON05_027630 [Acaryochloris sp. CCMEE 5410]|nr:hypothetical protein ON05_027630 [Acaryochloris sp. CCMEE 5410]
MSCDLNLSRPNMVVQGTLEASCLSCLFSLFFAPLTTIRYAIKFSTFLHTTTSKTVMGVLYSAFPVTSEVREWLAEEGHSVPRANGSPPTPNQLQMALETLTDHSVSFNTSGGVWQAQINDPNSLEDGPWTIVKVLKYTSPDEPCEYFFEKGWPELIIKVAQRIAQQCGPIAIVPDTGCPAVIVEADSDVDDIISTWGHLTG